jgi:hypothetical protein
MLKSVSLLETQLNLTFGYLSPGLTHVPVAEGALVIPLKLQEADLGESYREGGYTQYQLLKPFMFWGITDTWYSSTFY